MNEQQRKKLKENQDYINQFIDGVEFEVYTEWRDLDHDRCGWRDITYIADFGEYDKADIRIKQTKPSIDWNHVHPDYMWMATDESGLTYLYDQDVKLSEADKEWMFTNNYVKAESYVSFKPGTCDWRDSLVKRPDDI